MINPGTIDHYCDICNELIYTPEKDYQRVVLGSELETCNICGRETCSSCRKLLRFSDLSIWVVICNICENSNKLASQLIKSYEQLEETKRIFREEINKDQDRVSGLIELLFNKKKPRYHIVKNIGEL
jgi:hypothetical protein